MEVMNKILSESDATNKRLEFPARSLSAFPMPDGRYAKPWLKGEWHDYVHQKGLHKGDKVILTMDEEENGERIYRIRAERKHFGFWYSIDDQQ
ncbi:hypothetical protein NC652_027160 [Populus alba x Populus x berolinensis]|nr:hypothetical protein NC652_027160 [Populus alba x Populus x berolinensis]